MKKKLVYKQTLRVSEMSVKMARHRAVKDCGNVDYALERWNKTHSKQKKRKILVRQESIKTKKNKKKYTFRNMVSVFKRKPTSCSYHLASIALPISCCI